MERATVNRLTQYSRAAVAGLLIVWVFAAAFLSSGRHLHDEIHHDSKQATHQCAITVFERGETLASSSGSEIVWVVGETVRTQTSSQVHFASSVLLHPNSTRGPPAGFIPQS